MHHRIDVRQTFELLLCSFEVEDLSLLGGVLATGVQQVVYIIQVDF